MFFVYILYSFIHSKTYVGFTSNLIQRFYAHNFHGNTGWTKNFRPWVVIHCEIFDEKSNAMKRERELKSGKGRDWIDKNLHDWIKVFG